MLCDVTGKVAIGELFPEQQLIGLLNDGTRVGKIYRADQIIQIRPNTRLTVDAFPRKSTSAQDFIEVVC